MKIIGSASQCFKPLSNVFTNAHDLNYWLSLFIAVLFLMVGALFFVKGGNTYISAGTILMIGFLCLQCLLFLRLNRKYQDPFIILLIANLILFYLLRILTLLISTHSSVLIRYPTSSSSINITIGFIILSNFAILMGFMAANRRRKPQKKYAFKPLRHSFAVFMPVLAIFAYYALYVLPVDIHHRFMQYLSSVLLHRGTIFIFVTVFMVSFYRQLSHKLKFAHGITLLLYLVVVTFLGSRGGLLSIVIWVGVSILSVKEKITLKWKVLLLIIPLLFLQYYIFAFATFVRGYFPEVRGKSDERIASYMTIPGAISTMNATQTVGTASTIERIFNRIGFLDVSTDLVSHKAQYQDVINFKYYFKSIVDNCLTPGMNIFHTPRAAHSLSYIYYGRQNNPSHEDIKKAYQSDMFTVYGEYYILFGGVFALVVMFAGAYVFKAIYIALHHKDAFLHNCYKALLLYVFLLWINSFGIDWLILDLICISLTFLFAKVCYALSAIELNTKLVRDNYSPNL